MIAMLRGTVWQILDNRVVLDVQGVGYMVHVPINCLMAFKTGEEILLFIHLVMKEDDISLYGFHTLQEKELFVKMIAVSGIGPKAALAILSTYSCQQVKAAIVSEQVSLLTKVQGIGPKTARRLVFDLKEQISIDETYQSVAANDSSLDGAGMEGIDALQSLLVLGFSQREAQAALEKVRSAKGELPMETMIKEALRSLASAKSQ